MTLRKTFKGYDETDDDSIFTFIMHYDEAGVYVGQTQSNMMDDDSTDIFFRADIVNGKPCVNGVPVPPLTKEAMAGAEE